MTEQFTVVDGEYRETFSTIEEARVERDTCRASMGSTGWVYILDSEGNVIAEESDEPNPFYEPTLHSKSYWSR